MGGLARSPRVALRAAAQRARILHRSTLAAGEREFFAASVRDCSLVPREDAQGAAIAPQPATLACDACGHEVGRAADGGGYILRDCIPTAPPRNKAKEPGQKGSAREDTARGGQEVAEGGDLAARGGSAAGDDVVGTGLLALDLGSDQGEYLSDSSD